MTYQTAQPTPAEVAALPGVTVLEFGTDWCPICQAARGDIDTGLADADVQHLRVEDGRGRPLGRAFRVKLWPTLVFLRDGLEVARVVRPTTAAEVVEALATVAPAG